MEISKRTKKAGVFLLLMTMIVIGTIGALASGIFDKPVIIPEPTYPIDHLFIDASFLLKTGETNKSVNVSCDLYMTNIWEKESGEIKATAYVSEQNTNLAVFKNTVEFGIIDANSTKELNIPVIFSGKSYKVEILLFENNKLFKKVTLSITTYQNYYLDHKGTIVYNEGRMPFASKDGQWSIEGSLPEVQVVH